ncbi:MAG: hypothetical protein Q8N28_01145 [bacterium]|nr:hypothetical protein [bacterium]
MLLANIIKDKYLRVVGVLSVLVVFLAGAVFYSQPEADPLQAEKLGQTTTPLIIRFEADKDIDFLAGRMEVLGILLSALTIILINFFLANFLYRRERFLSYIFSFASLVIAVLILIIISVIVSVN